MIKIVFLTLCVIIFFLIFLSYLAKNKQVTQVFTLQTFLNESQSIDRKKSILDSINNFFQGKDDDGIESIDDSGDDAGDE